MVYAILIGHYVRYIIKIRWIPFFLAAMMPKMHKIDPNIALNILIPNVKISVNTSMSIIWYDFSKELNF